MNTSTLHREVITNHNTWSQTTKHGRLSVRKTAGEYHVAFEDFEMHKVTTQTFKTLRGAEIAVEGWRASL